MLFFNNKLFKYHEYSLCRIKTFKRRKKPLVIFKNIQQLQKPVLRNFHTNFIVHRCFFNFYVYLFYSNYNFFKFNGSTLSFFFEQFFFNLRHYKHYIRWARFNVKNIRRLLSYIQKRKLKKRGTRKRALRCTLKLSMRFNISLGGNKFKQSYKLMKIKKFNKQRRTKFMLRRLMHKRRNSLMFLRWYLLFSNYAFTTSLRIKKPTIIKLQTYNKYYELSLMKKKTKVVK